MAKEEKANPHKRLIHSIFVCFATKFCKQTELEVTKESWCVSSPKKNFKCDTNIRCSFRGTLKCQIHCSNFYRVVDASQLAQSIGGYVPQSPPLIHIRGTDWYNFPWVSKFWLWLPATLTNTWPWLFFDSMEACSMRLHTNSNQLDSQLRFPNRIYLVDALENHTAYLYKKYWKQSLWILVESQF